MRRLFGCVGGEKIFAVERIEVGKHLLLKIVSMLSGLVNRFDGSADMLREDSPEYVVGKI
jgi:hypothetical protein